MHKREFLFWQRSRRPKALKAETAAIARNRPPRNHAELGSARPADGVICRAMHNTAATDSDDPDDSKAAAAGALHVGFYMHHVEGGGAERVAVTLMRELARRGVALSLALHRDGGELRHLVPASVHVETFGTTRTFADFLPLRRFLRRARPDVLVSNLHHDNLVALLAKTTTSVPTRIVICQHAPLSQESLPEFGWRYRIVPHAYHLLRRRISGIVAVSDGVADDFARVCSIARDRITRIYNPVVDEAIVRAISAPAQHPWFDDSVPVFVSAARLVPSKDHATLLRAFARHRANHPARLFLMGSGPERSALRALANELKIAPDVEFAGFVQNPLPYMRAATAFVQSSRFEGFGVALVEALACGTPVVATDCPTGPAEVLGHGRFGRLVPVGDADAFSAAMGEDLRSAFPAARLRERARDFSVSTSVDAYLEFFQTLQATRVRPD